jgi:hypothetical protein
MCLTGVTPECCSCMMSFVEWIGHAMQLLKPYQAL